MIPLLLLLTGCVTTQSAPRLLPDVPVTYPGYRIGCPDVLSVEFAKHPRWSALVSVDVDGTIPLGEAGQPRVQGLTMEEAVTAVATAARVKESEVSVTVQEPRAARIFLTGPGKRHSRSVPYRGPISALELLQQQGIEPIETRPSEMFLVRSNVATGGKREIFSVAWDNPATQTLIVQPADHLQIGQSWVLGLARLLPRWLEPGFRKWVGLPLTELP